MREKILIVAEELLLRESLDVFLTYEGYETYRCPQYVDIHNFIHNFDPDLVLLHISPRRFREKDIFESLNLKSYLNEVPIVLLSENDTQYQSPLKHIIVSPFNETELLQRIKSQLEVIDRDDSN